MEWSWPPNLPPPPQSQVHNFAPSIQPTGYSYPAPTPPHYFPPQFQPMAYPYPAPTLPHHAPSYFSPPCPPMAYTYPPPTPCHNPYYTAASGGSNGTGGQRTKKFCKTMAQLALTGVVSGLMGGLVIPS